MTVIDPLGTPSVVYNRAGTVILEMDAHTTSPRPQIPYVSGHIIVLADVTTSNGGHLTLPASAEVGDLVEVHVVDAVSLSEALVFPPSGESVVPDFGVADAGNALLIRKVRSDLWSGTNR